MLYMPELSVQGLIPVEPSQVSELVHIPGVSPTRRGDLSSAVQVAFGLGFYTHYLHRCCYPAVESAAGYFVNSFEDLEPSCIATVNSYPYPQRAVSKVHSKLLFSSKHQ